MTYCAFFPLAALLIASALGVVFNRSPVRSAMCLVAALFLLAVVFVLLGAHLVAALQVVVYAGAIMVLFLFVIMLLNLQTEPPEHGRPGMRVMTAVATALFVLVVLQSLLATGSGGSVAPAATAPDFGSTAALSERLFTHFLLPFEITSVLLLVAVVGAVVIAKRRIEP